MNQIATTGIMLARTNFGEADKIITIITPDYGKIKVMARGVRKIKSKLAGGVELFSVSTITFIKGKNEIGTLVSTRLQTHFNHIVEDLNRTMVGYDILKFIHKATDDQCDSDYYHLLLTALADLNDTELDYLLIKCWFMARLLQLLGHNPNTQRDIQGNMLNSQARYQFDYQEMSFNVRANGPYTPNHVKILRLLLTEKPVKLRVISDATTYLPQIEQLLRESLQRYISM